MHRGATTSAALPTRHALLHCKHVGHQSGHPRRREIHGGPRQGGGGGAGQARRGRAGGGAAAAHEPPPQLARPASTAATQRRFGRGHWAVAALQLHAGATESSAGRSRARLLAHARRAALRAQLQAGGPLRTGARLGVAPLRRPRRCQNWLRLHCSSVPNWFASYISNLHESQCPDWDLGADPVIRDFGG